MKIGYLKNLGRHELEKAVRRWQTLHKDEKVNLEPVSYDINIDTFKDLDLNKTSQQRIDDLDETTYLDGTKFDSQMFIYNEILVNLPMKVLCRTDCKGICNRCGVNLNVSTCKCQDAEPGTGMSKILDVFNQFKEV